MKKVRICVGNDITTDQRVDRICKCFSEIGYEVYSVGIKRKKSSKLAPRKYNVIRLPLLFEKEVWFYLNIQIIFFFHLLFHKTDFIYANDLDTLLPCLIVSKIKRIPLIYDSHEYFTEVPELQDNKFAKKTWERIEKWAFPKVKHCITVCDPIARTYEKKYGKKVYVIRNIPTKKNIETVTNIPIDTQGKRVLLYQGAINKDRGVKEIIDAMEFLDKTLFLVVGGGDKLEEMKAYAIEKKLGEKIIFTGKLPFENLLEYTVLADLGLSTSITTCQSYEYGLPNKFFDYIQAEIPVLISPSNAITPLLEKYQVGEYIQAYDAKKYAMQVDSLLNNKKKMEYYKANCKVAKEILCWENEQKTLIEIIRKADPIKL